MEYLTNFYRDSYQKELKKWRRKVLIQSADRPEVEFKVACDVESVNFRDFHGFDDVTGNFELDIQAIGWLYLSAALNFSSTLL